MPYKDKKRNTEYAREWRKNHPEYKEKDRIWRKNYRLKNPNYNRSTKLKYEYGLTIEQYEKILEQQNFKYAICETDEIGNSQTNNWLVDHNHNTGEIRGLLCHGCNTGLGRFKDSIEILEKAIKYLKRENNNNNGDNNH